MPVRLCRRQASAHRHPLRARRRLRRRGDQEDSLTNCPGGAARVKSRAAPPPFCVMHASCHRRRCGHRLRNALMHRMLQHAEQCSQGRRASPRDQWRMFLRRGTSTSIGPAILPKPSVAQPLSPYSEVATERVPASSARSGGQFIARIPVVTTILIVISYAHDSSCIAGGHRLDSPMGPRQPVGYR